MKWDRKTIATGTYWLFAFAAFFANYLIRNSEGYPSVLATFPLSLIVLEIVPLDQSPLANFLGTGLGNFLMFPVLCGGLNAFLIYALLKVIESARKSPPA